MKQGAPISASLGRKQDPSNKTTALYSHLDSVDLLDGFRVFAGGCQSIHSVCRDPAYRPCVQQVSNGPQATRTVGLGADAGWRVFGVLLRALNLAINRRQQIYDIGNKQTNGTQGRIQSAQMQASHCALLPCSQRAEAALLGMLHLKRARWFCPSNKESQRD